VASSSDFEEVRDRFIAERPTYARLASRVSAVLAEGLRRERLAAHLSDRAKEVSSLVKKLLRPEAAERESLIRVYEDMTDKAGVRATFIYLDHVYESSGLVEALFDVQKIDDKSKNLAYSELGYLGVHCDVRLRAEDLQPGQDDELAGLVCEIQLRTNSQGAWAEASHELLYKGALEPDDVVKRMIYRMVALVEVFDESLDRGRATLHADPSFAPTALVNELETSFLMLTGLRSDRSLSFEIVPTIAQTYDEAVDRIFGDVIGPFVERHNDKLRAIYANYRDDERANPLLSQAESLMLFERIESDQHLLQEAWPTVVPERLLENLSVVWGKPL
jgi:ppGpp synthetase/RelA/SpoT-type nucleotidyltranferase